MSIEPQVKTNRARQADSQWPAIISIFSTLIILLFIFFGAIYSLTPSGQKTAQWLSWFLALDSVQLWWYVTRASGIVAYLLLWFSMVLGLGVTSKSFDRLLDRLFTYDFHQFISLLSIAFVILHIVVLMFDHYLPYSIWQILIPFISPYRPFWVGVGVIGFYFTLLVTVTFYMRKRIGLRSFRIIHYISFIGYLGATLHGIYSGTDSPLLAIRLMYQGTGLVVVFLTVFWLVMLGLKKLEAHQQAQEAARLARRRHATSR
jgi:predicted ferric reductase